jgi:hypothetical protein
MSRPPRPEGVQAILDDLSNGIFSSTEAVNQHLARRMGEYNRTPQPELGGLSPDQTAQLLYGDWTSTGALRAVGNAPIEQLCEIPIVADARTILDFVAANTPVKLTPAGNLQRGAVAALVPRLRTSAENADLTGIDDARIRNEDDVRWLPIVRHVLLFAKLLTKRKGLVLTARGRALRADERAGDLFETLFRTFFRQFDLSYLYADHRHAGLQQTIAYSFYQLRRVDAEWISEKVLAERAWLASARDPMNAFELQYGDMRDAAFRYRVLEPLVLFGLLERRLLPGVERWLPRAEFRRTALFDALLRFEFRST